MNILKKAIFIATSVLCTAGCDDTVVKLEVNETKTIDLSIPQEETSLEFSVIIPEEIEESGLTMAVESPFNNLKIELLDPQNKVIAVNFGEEGYFFPKSGRVSGADQNKWGFDKVIAPSSGRWTLRFTKLTLQESEKVDIHLTIGLVKKYSAFIKPFKEIVTVGESCLIQLNFSEHGRTLNIEGHTIRIFNDNNEQVDQITASAKLKTNNNAIVNSTNSTYLARYIPQKSGIYTLDAKFKGSIDREEVTFIARNTMKVVDPIIQPVSLAISSKSLSNENEVLTVTFKANALKSFWLVVTITFSKNGELFKVSRNKKLIEKESVEFTYEIDGYHPKTYNDDSIVIVNLELVDFNVEGTASLLRDIPINHPVIRTPQIIELR